MTMVTVEPIDREAVHAFHNEMGQRLLSDIKHGTNLLDAKGEDGEPIYQAFARHRIAAIEATGVVELRQRLEDLKVRLGLLRIFGLEANVDDQVAECIGIVKRALTQLAKGSE